MMIDRLDMYKCLLADALKSSKKDKKKHVKSYVCCEKCKRTGVTLRKIDDDYICNDCYKELQNGK